VGTPGWRPGLICSRLPARPCGQPSAGCLAPLGSGCPSGANGWRALAFVVGFLAFALSASAATITLVTGEILTGEVELGNPIVVRKQISEPVKIDPATVLRLTLREGNDDYTPGMVLRSGARVADAPAEQVAWRVYRKFTAIEARAIPAGKTGVLLPNGDFFEGKVRSAEAAEVKVLSPLFGPRTFRADQVLAVVLAEVKPVTAAYEVRTVNGGVRLGEQFALDGRGATLDGTFIPAAEIAEVRAGPSRHRALADLETSRVETALGTPGKAFALHAMPDGAPLAVGPDRFDRGVSAWTNCAVGWAVPMGFTELIGRCGVAPNVPPNVRLAFAVYADGKLAFRSQPMTSADAPQAFAAKFAGARTVALRVEPQFPSTARGVGVWIEPVLLRR
jgi:hypothetical protein